MSSSEPRVARDHAARSGMATLRAVGTTARVAIGVALAIALAGCAGGGGFRPMYASLDGGPALEAKLASVDVSTIPGRVGQRIRNQLIFQNTGGGARAAPLYRLDVTFTESIQATLVKTTGEAASSIYVIDARFQLTDIAAKKVVLSGGSYARSPFDRFPSIYANVRAREDAEVRAANTIAEDIRSRLATFLSREKI